MDEEISENEFQFPKNSVLGMQAESCFEAYLMRSKNYKILTANLQIHGEKETLGELDYILRNLKTNRVIHIELACKFYLYDVDAGSSEEEKWIGPNRKDSLYDKLEKVKWKQFPLLYKNETIEKLESLEVEIPSFQQLCLKAFLFIPKKLNRRNFPANYAASVVGHWIKHKDFSEEDRTALYAIPNKKEWLLPMESIVNWYSFSEVEKLIELQIQNKKSPLIYKKTLQKVERFFVVCW
ncbi:DUF1853 family protein [Aequorivita capsosiphonis]|uniref:DUF1853 family protein n=1 Tax=Aequorivita capsosiphonis TaxID=487317 RepID=UPI0004247FCA|nr:DUF1853 family protein [Aequorivita capsosiphonis]